MDFRIQFQFKRLVHFLKADPDTTTRLIKDPGLLESENQFSTLKLKC